MSGHQESIASCEGCGVIQESSLLAPGSPILIEEKDDDEDEECAMEKGEESSKGTGVSSMESNDEVWPAELIIEEVSEELNKANGIIFRNPKETNEEDDHIAKTEVYGSSCSCDDCDIFDDSSDENETTEELVMVNKQPARSSKMRFWILSMLLLALLMLLLLLSLNHHKAISYYQLYLDSSIIRGV